MLEQSTTACPICAAPIQRCSIGRPRIYCSDRCKGRASYAVHRDKRVAEKRERWAENADDINARRRAARAEHPEQTKEAGRAYYRKHAEAISAVRRERYKKDPGKIIAQVHRYYRKNRERVIAYKTEYALNNKIAISIRNRLHYNSNPSRRIKESMSRLMNKSLISGKGNTSWQRLVGYTLKELMEHLESQFVAGMSWENHGRTGWHIDHIRPIASFSFDSPGHPEFQQCWALSNLQPLWAPDNLRKGARFDPA